MSVQPRGRGGWWICAVVATWSVSASAQAPCERDDDEVVLRSGETLAGVIAEYAPDGTVTLVLPSGETRRLPAAEVRSVVLAEARNDEDAARRSPVPLAGDPRPAGRRVRVRLRADDGSALAFSIETYAYRPANPNMVDERRSTNTSLLTGYRFLCRSPCAAWVPEGPQLFGVARPGDDPVAAEALTPIDGSTRVVAHLQDRGVVRALGIVVAIAGAVAGGALALTGAVQKDTTTKFRLMGVGALVALSFALVGGALMYVPDRAEVEAR